MSSILSHTPELSPTKRALIAVRDMRLRLAAAERAQREPVAIIGMAHRFPGGANDPASFWQLLRDGVDAITRIPSERWDADLYYDPDPNAAGRAYTRDGGFLDAVDQFDAAFFGISPREALEMDPQQRLLLELAWEALERAGLPPDSLHGTATGVFVGISSVDFGRLRALQSSVLEVNAYMGTGNANSVAAGRLAYVLGLQGPNMAVDTACSSSLLAVHLACRSLRAGECRQALAGGVNLILTPESHIILSQARMLSPDGRCKTFDATADGYVRGEGAGLVVLKRLSDALADGDRVLAVIRGTATNQDGRSNGLTAPSGQAQEAVIRAALADAGVAPRQVSYVEAHGTGTTLGDPIEMRALGAVFGVDRPPETPLVVASVKTNIGHLEAAAGIAGLIKVVLMLQQSEVPPHLHLQEPNPYIPWETLPVEVPQRPRPWPAAQGPRLAGVNSFGFSGSNVHLIVEEAPPAPVAAPTAPAPRPLHLLTLAAANETALTDMAGRLRAWLAEAAPPLADVAYTANAGRARLPQRLALVAADTADLDAKLAAFLAGDLPTGGTAGRAPAEPPRIAFSFTGQGAQYPNMARQLYDTEPTFRATLDECDALLRPHLEHGLLDVLFAAAAGGAADPDLIHQTAYTQPALFAVEVALARLWQAWGITPDFVTGHSIGEFAAAVIAGVFSLADGCKLVAARGRLMQALPRDGAMAAVFADEARVADAVAPFAAQVSIAGINGPQQVVISGAKTAVDAILAQLDADGIQSRSLSVSHAFHSPLMDPMLDAFAEVAATVTYAEPRIPLVSDVTGRVAAPGALTQPAYWRQHVRAAVRFADAVQTLHAEGCTHFLEIGPSPTLIGMGRRCLPDDAAVWLASLRHDRENWAQLLDSLAALYVSGAAVDWRAYDRPYGRQWVDLPTYPFQRRRFWPDTTAGTVTQLAAPGGHPLLGSRLPSALRQVSFAGQVSRRQPAWLADRQQTGAVLLPEAACIEMGLAAAAKLWPTAVWQLTDLRLEEPLALPEQTAVPTQTILTSAGRHHAALDIFAAPDEPVGADAWRLLAAGQLAALPADTARPAPVQPAAVQARGTAVPLADWYTALTAAGLQLGPRFRCVEAAWRGAGEARARLQLPAGTDGYRLYPPLLDPALLLLAVEAAPQAYAITAVDQVTHYAAGPPAWAHVRVQPAVDAQLTADVAYLDEAGQVLVAASGIRLRPVMPAAIEAQTLDPNAWLYEVAWRELAWEAPAQLPPAGHWLILADESGVGVALADALTAAGDTCQLVWSGGAAAAGGRPALDPADPAAFEALLRGCLTGAERPLRGVLFLWGLDLPSPATVPMAAAEAAQLACLGGALHLTQALIRLVDELRLAPPPALWILTQLAQVVETQPAALPAVAQTPLWGFARSVALEQRHLPGGVVDLDQIVDQAALAALAAEIRLPQAEGQIVFRAGRRYVARLVQGESRALPALPVGCRADGAYLITGGLGDLGLLLARWLVSQGARRLILLSRTPLPPRSTWSQDAEDTQTARRIRAIRELEALGAVVHTGSVDVADAPQLFAFLASYRETDGRPIRGVVHAAGVLRDRSLLQLDLSLLREVYRPKFNGAWLLHDLLRQEPMDFFVLFSSAASLTGSAGQANYAAANAFLDGLAHYRHALGLPAMSINWGAWGEIGMAARADLAKQRARLGLGVIPPRQGLRMLQRLLWQDGAQIGVVSVTPPQLRMLAPEGTRFLSELDATAAADEAAVEAERVDEQIMALPPAKRRAAIAAHLRRRVAQILMMEAADVPVDRNLMELGIDSIMIMDLNRQLDRDFSLNVYVREIFEHPTVDALAGFLQAEVEKIHVAADGGDEPIAAVSALPAAAAVSAAARPNPPAVFLLSAPRSGSTLLRVMLAGHPALFSPPELHLLSYATLQERAAGLSARADLLEGLQRAVMALLDLDREASAALLDEWTAQNLPVSEVYRRLQAHAAPRQLVDKSPGYARQEGVLERAEAWFDRPKYIHLVRHPYAAIASMVRARVGRLLMEETGDLYAAAESLWTTTTTVTQAFLQDVDPARHFLVRYEDLVTEPERVMRDLCAFLEIPFDPAVLQPYSGARMTDGVYGVWASIGDPNFQKFEQIEGAKADDWRQVRLPRRLGGLARLLADNLGYALPWPPPTAESDAAPAEPAAPPRPMPRAAGEDGPQPLSFAQQRLFFLDQLEPALTAYNITLALELAGTLDRGALQRSLQEIAARHEALRMNVVLHEGQPVQVVMPPPPVPLPETDLSGLAPDVQQARLEALLEAETRTPFDLAKDVKLRVRLLRLAPERHVLLGTMHHIAADDWSLGIFFREVAALYAAIAAERPSSLPPLPIQYADYARWQRAWLQGERLTRQLAYWRQQLLPEPDVLALPTDRPRPAVQQYTGAGASFVLPRSLVDGLRALSQAEGATLFMALLAAYQVLLHRYSGQTDIPVGTPISGRDAPETQGLIGFFVNTLVLRGDLRGDPTFRQVLQRARSLALAAYQHQDVPFEKLLEALQPARRGDHTPFFQTMLVLQNTPRSAVEMPGLAFRPLEAPVTTAKFDLSLLLRERPDGLRGRFEYRTDLFEAATITRLINHLGQLLTGAVANPDTPISRLPLLTAAERRQLLQTWQETAVPFDETQTLPQLLLAQAQRTPDNVAVVMGDVQLTYAELLRRACGLARQLQALGVGPDVLVGIGMARAPEMVVALLGVLLAGGAYVPIDPDDPLPRIRFVLQDAQVPVLLTQTQLLTAFEQLMGDLALPLQVLCVDALPAADETPLETAVAPHHLAYAIYTSGSTGQPKAALIPHSAIVNYMQWMQATFAFNADDRLLQKTAFSFDAAVWDFLAPLLSGGQLVLAAPGGQQDAAYLLQAVQAHQITTLQVVPTQLRLLLDMGGLAACGSLRLVVCGGEALPADLVNRFLDVLPDVPLINLYGPTEAAIASTMWRCERLPDGAPTPIGRPIANVRTYVLDANRQPVPVGVAGELAIGGAGVGRGYWRRPELTADRFVPDPFRAADDADGRLYLTGDLVRYLPDGNLVFLGRLDQQVKLRGFRIEPGEVEAMLTTHPAVRQCVVLVQGETADERQLVAYVVVQGDVPADLRPFLRARLPAYMVPAVIVPLESLPLLPSGKVDRRALPQARPDAAAAYAPPRTETEQIVAAIWAELLRQPRVGRHDDFFELGGHSLLATRVVARLQAALHVPLQLRTLFDEPTVAQLAERIETLRWVAHSKTAGGADTAGDREEFEI